MSTLLLEEKDLRNDRVRTLMRVRTLTVLGRLDPSRKSAVMQFLVEAGLVQGVEKRTPLIGLSDANLNEADLNGALLSDAELSGAKLSDADLSGAYLRDANLRGAKEVTYEILERQVKSLKGATMPDGTVFSDEFKPALSVRLNDGWERTYYMEETPDKLPFLFRARDELNLVSEPPEPGHLETGLDECGRRLGGAHRRDDCCVSRKLPSGLLQRPLRSPLSCRPPLHRRKF
jgi:Pentapeptide repeats (8 copies)